MRLADVFRVLRERDAALYVDWTDGTPRLRYVGVSPLRDDALRAGITEHRAMLIELFTYAPDGRCVVPDCYRLKIEGRATCPDHEETTVDEYDDESYPLERELAGSCTPSRPCPDHIDDVIEDWQQAQLDRHLEGVR